MSRALLLLLSLLAVSFVAPAHAEDEGVTVVDRDVEIGVGVPDEILFAPPTLEQVDVPFDLDFSVTRVVGTLSWPDDGGVTDIDFELVAPTGARTGTQGQTATNPERAELGAGPAGAWVAQIYPFTSLGTTARLTIVAYPAASEPLSTSVQGESGVGRLDLADLVASASGGQAPYVHEWDTDDDGVYETLGPDVALALSPGTHVVGLRTTDALGAVAFASRTVTAWSADRALHAICGGDPFAPFWALEYNQTHDTCWVHDGHHTYFVGDTIYALREVHGYAFAVEQQFSPGPDPDLRVQASLDGLTWTDVGRGVYAMLPPVDDPLAIPTRQAVAFDFAASGEPFRYLRVHMPPSAGQGLSGYLDHSDLHLVADEVGAAPAPVLSAATRELRCEDHIMERFFATHPCTYGGVNRWDSASFYHTYVVGDGAVVDRVRGSFTLAPFRLDDFFSGEDAPQETAAYVLTSDDGRTWTHEGTIPALYGVPATFDLELGGREARFVRLFPQYHALFDETGTTPSLHHPRAFFVTSAVAVEGALPS